ncbi:MAG: copper chaperone PCu(A)C [Aeropyrum sp.]|nr:copper chaperone PCu(A)C [Aeropyrum sp.]
MKNQKTLVIAAVIIVVVIALAAYTMLQGEGEVRVEDTKAIYTGSVIGVYGSIINGTDNTVCIESLLVAENVGADLTATIHKTVEENGVVRMIPAGPICIEAGETFELAPGPGNHHIMISGDKNALRQVVGDNVVELVLKLDNGSELLVKAIVSTPGSGS